MHEVEELLFLKNRKISIHLPLKLIAAELMLVTVGKIGWSRGTLGIPNVEEET
jgi:hypothetical protein